MDPKVIFQRAGPTYERMLQRAPDFQMPSDEVFAEKLEELEKRWNEWGSKIIVELNAVTHLAWMDADIRCYVTAGITASFSHPLTLKVYESMDDMFDVFVHELIHRLLNNPDHPESFKESKRALLHEYENESKTVKYHILLHALQAHILMMFFGEVRLRRASEFIKNPDYVRSWEIVNDLGYENILRRVFK